MDPDATISRLAQRLAGVLLVVWVFGATSAFATNVIFIVADDLNTDLGCYGDGIAQTPHIDALAARGVLFENAHCQYPVCGPSRASFLSGLRPDRFRSYNWNGDWIDAYPDLISLPEHFTRRGYRTRAIGKILHGLHILIYRYENDRRIWTDPWFASSELKYYNESPATELEDARTAPVGSNWGQRWPLPSHERGFVPDSAYPDGAATDEALEQLNSYASAWNENGEPFFLAVGFMLPHLPYNSPDHYWSLYDESLADLEAVNLAHFDSSFRPPARGAEFTVHNGNELATSRHPDTDQDGPDRAEALRLAHAYSAAVSYIDAQVGRIVRKVDDLGLSEDTVIVLTSDHGYHIADFGRLWGKASLFERTTRVPLIISAPDGAEGRVCKRLVELVDLYPTITNLTGTGEPELGGEIEIDGRDFSHLVRNPSLPFKKAAFSQQHRNELPGFVSETKGQGVGRSLRTDRYRYTEWYRVSGLQKQYQHIFEQPEFVELYDYSVNPLERFNLAGIDHYQDLCDKLSEVLHSDALKPTLSGSIQTFWSWQDALRPLDDLTGETIDPRADPDGDRLLNWEEYVLGGDPFSDSSGELAGVDITLIANEGEVAVLVRRPSGPQDVEYLLERSADGSLWETLPELEFHHEPDGWDLFTARISTRAGKKEFYRMRANFLEAIDPNP